jgi:hypothetical protein
MILMVKHVLSMDGFNAAKLVNIFVFNIWAGAFTVWAYAA